MMRALWRSVAALAAVTMLAGLALLFSAAPASAHADLLSTSPRADAVLQNAPEDVALTFSDTVDLNTAVVQVIEPNGETTGGLGVPAHLNGLATTLAVDLPADLGRGTRTVIYRVVSTDGHPVQGSLKFSVGVATASAAPDVLGKTDAMIGLYLGIARWVAFVGLALALGTLLLVFLAWPGGLAVSGVRRLLWAGLGSLSLSSVASLLLYGPYISGAGLADVLDTGPLDLAIGTRVGELLLLRLALLAGVGVALYLVFRRSRPGTEEAQAPRPPLGGVRPAVATLAVGGALALTWSLATHSADGGSKLVTLPVDLVHMLAMSAWLGAMPALLVLLLKVKDGAALARAVPVFSRNATICVIALVATGVVQSWRQVGSADALTSTTYGGWLIVKLGLVVAILGLGALARWWAAPRLGETPPARWQQARKSASASVRRAATPAPVAGTGRFGRLVAVETGLGALVLAVTATLVSTQPADAAHRSQELAAAAKASPVMLVASPVDTNVGFQLGDVKTGTEPVAFATPLVAPPGSGKGRGWVGAVISPAFGGLPNELHISVTDEAGRRYGISGAAIDLRAVGGPERSQPFPLRSTGLGHFSAAFTVPSAGQWQIGILLHDLDGKEAVVLVPFQASSSAA